jgi:membrane protease YdiL (CAAX protease family)
VVGVSAMPDRDPYDFIDLARLGRTDWWSGVKAFLRILGWQFLVGIPFGLAAAFGARWINGPRGEVLLLALLTIGWWMGVRGAVTKTHGRPFLSLIAPDLRFELRRAILGAALWFAVESVIVAVSLAGQAAFDPDGVARFFMRLAWPDRNTLLVGLISVAIFPFQAASEELVFRGWLTQTVGQALRRRWLVVLIVAVVFALAHGVQRGVFAFIAYIILSIGLSALSLGDRRLELAMGAHAANNIFVVLLALFVPVHGAHQALFLQSTVMSWIVPLVVAAQMGLLYLVARRFMRRTIAPLDAIMPDEYSAPIG